jgi:hypothetical protein
MMNVKLARLEDRVDRFLMREGYAEYALHKIQSEAIRQTFGKIRNFSRLDQFVTDINSTFSDRDGNGIKQEPDVILCKKTEIKSFLSFLVRMTNLEIDHVGLEKMKEKIILAVLCFAWHSLSLRVRDLFRYETMPLYDGIETDYIKYIFKTDCVKTEKDAMNLIFYVNVKSYFESKGYR